jgi:2-polyprenyl-3-methyl-5-hydroxy-6-metoxy-1,4-benzoquinol methylase
VPPADPCCVVCEIPGAGPDPFFYHWQGRRYRIHRCGGCTHQFVHPPVNPSQQAAIHDDVCFRREGDWSGGVFHADYAEAEPELRDEARHILRWLGPPKDRLLDIGCAGGTFLDETAAFANVLALRREKADALAPAPGAA